MFGLGLPELLLILVIGLIFFGPGKLPEIGSALGKSMKEFKQAVNSTETEIKKPVKLPKAQKPKKLCLPVRKLYRRKPKSDGASYG